MRIVIMASHNATGRSTNAHQSKAERQAMMNPARQAQAAADAKAKNEAESKPKTEVAKIGPKTDPATRGLATQARWAVCLKKRPGAKLFMASDIKALPKSSSITSVVAGNPKKQGATTRYEKYGFDGVKGATTTIEAYLNKIKARWSEGVAYADIAWDINHGFIEVELAAEQPTSTEQPAEQSEPTTEQPTPEQAAA